MIIVLEGIDGSGKTTTAKLLCQELEKKLSSVVYWSKSSAEFENSFVKNQMLRLRELIWDPLEGKPPDDIMGTHYYMFLIAAWFSILQKHRLLQIQESNTLAIFDGWFYRNIAKAIIRSDLDRGWLRTLFAGISEPDLVVLLDVDPAIAWNRRSEFNPDEVGRWDGFAEDNFNSYCSYQQLVRDLLLEFAAEYRWRVINQTKDMSVEEVVAQIRDQAFESVQHMILPRDVSASHRTR